MSVHAPDSPNQTTLHFCREADFVDERPKITPPLCQSLFYYARLYILIEMNSKISFAVTVGNREIAEKTKFLIKSVRAMYPSAPILTYLIKKEKSTLEQDTIDFFQNNTTLRIGEFPRPAYPISSKLKAMSLAAQSFEFDYLILLDSDTVLVDRFESFLNTVQPADIYVKPVDVSRKWESQSEWEEIASVTEYDVPKIRTVSTVDKKRIFPFYNAGVVICTTSSFPDDWLELSLLVHDISGSVFSDQVALGLLTQDYSNICLSELENYPLHLYTYVPDDVILIHYHDYSSLTKIKNKRFVDMIDKIGLNNKVSLRARMVGKLYEPGYHPSSSKIDTALGALKKEGTIKLSKKAIKAIYKKL